MNEIKWADKEWKMINAAIAAEIENSQLAHKVITKKVELKPEENSVPQDTFDYGTGMVDETPGKIPISTQEVRLTKEQADDPDLSRAIVTVRRAAQKLAVEHDRAVFVTAIRDRVFGSQQGNNGSNPIIKVSPGDGDGLVAAVARAIAELERSGYRSGFVMVAGLNVFTQLNRRVPGAADLPIKAVRELLDNGPIHQSSVLDSEEALVLSLSGEEIDRAVAMGPTLDFRKVDSVNGIEDVRVLRLYERFLTRFKQTKAAVLLHLTKEQPEHLSRGPEQPKRKPEPAVALKE